MRGVITPCGVALALTAVLALIARVAAGGATAAWVLGTGLALTAVLGLTLYLRHREAARLIAQLDDLLHGKHDIDFSECREGDLAILRNEVAKMSFRLARANDQLTSEKTALATALADISHQLRTPLTAMGVMVPLIERTSDEGERRRKLRELERMVDRVNWLVTVLLKIAKVDAGALSLDMRPVALSDVVRLAFEPLEVAFDVHDVTLVREVDPTAILECDANWTAEALGNILKNALEHTPAGGEVRVLATEDALAVRITVTDTGPGIAPADLEHVFDRFYRGEGSDQTPAAAGFGVGLSLAQSLVAAQGGTLGAGNDLAAGARFTMTFPKVTV